MASTNPELVQKIEAILANAKRLNEDDFPARLALMKQVDSLYQDLEPPINLVSLISSSASCTK